MPSNLAQRPGREYSSYTECTIPPETPSPSAHLSKPELHALADALLLHPAEALESAIAFVCAESRGHWHNRARAMLCRRLKHVPLTAAQSRQLTEVIGNRLTEGRFTEQFRDQLRLAIHLDPPRIHAAATAAAGSAKPHVRRLAAWVLAHFPFPPDR